MISKLQWFTSKQQCFARILKPAIAMCGLLFFPLSLWGQIQVFPTQVVLTATKNSSHVTIRNNEEVEMTYELTFKGYERDQKGRTKEASLREDQKKLAQYLKFTPKKFTLKPNGSQVVRILFSSKEKAELPVGHLHLHISPEIPAATQKKNGFQLRARIAAAVPIVLLDEKSKMDFTVDRVAWIEKEKKLAVNILKKSINPILGHLVVFDSKDNQIAFLRGIAIYDSSREFIVDQFEASTEQANFLKPARIEIQPMNEAMDFPIVKKTVN